MSPGRHDGHESLMKRRIGKLELKVSHRACRLRAREAKDEVHMSAGGMRGNGGSPAGRINAALEKAPHFREAEINSSRGY